MSRKATRKQIEAAYEEGKKAALAGDRGAPTPYDDADRGWAWMAGYDSTHPKDCPPKREEQEWGS